MPESFLWLGKYHTMPNKPPMKVLVHHVFHKVASFFHLPERQFGIVEANPKYAIRELRKGNALTVYPGGDQDNTKSFFDRNKITFFEHHGYVKLAIKAGVPILPIVGVGGGETLFVLNSGHYLTEKSKLAQLIKLKSWPIYWSFPFGWHIGHGPRFSIPLPSQITISILPPIYLNEYTLEDADNEEKLKEINFMIVNIMQNELDKLAKNRIPIIGKIS
jgi:1-acyl-sn-glycerol-3-phosphate acyltransferase